MNVEKEKKEYKTPVMIIVETEGSESPILCCSTGYICSEDEDDIIDGL